LVRCQNESAILYRCRTVCGRQRHSRCFLRVFFITL